MVNGPPESELKSERTITAVTLSEELQWRGFVHQSTYKDIKLLDGDPITFYWGVDPSADSMQVGNLAIAMMVRHFIDHGHKAILLVGGATGMIGDPDGKAQERDLKSLDEIAKNKTAISEQYQTVFAGQSFEIVDNYDWFKGLGYLDFLRDVGKHMPMSQMLQREFVQTRLGEEGTGISYAEFSYALIQGYDFLHLFRDKGVTLQVCGSDQWGNCIAGVELIRRIDGGEANVWSAPLVINKTTGVKFGKTEGGAVWLDPKKTSVYQFYQFWFNVDDEGVADYLKIYTLLSKDDIINTVHQQKENPGARPAQRALAYEVTKLVHGVEAADSVVRATSAMFGSQADLRGLSPEDWQVVGDALPVIEASPNGLLMELLVKGKLASSNTEARRFLTDSAVYINNEQFSSDKFTLEQADFINGYVLLRRGKNQQVLLRLSQ